MARTHRIKNVTEIGDFTSNPIEFLDMLNHLSGCCLEAAQESANDPEAERYEAQAWTMLSTELEATHTRLTAQFRVLGAIR